MTNENDAAITQELLPDYVVATTVPDVLTRAAMLWPEAEAVVIDGGRTTYADLLAGARQHAAGFLQAGVSRGETVGILSPLSIEFYEVMFGALMVGAVVAPLNYRFRGEELAYVIEDSDSVMLVATNRFAPELDMAQRLQEAIGEFEETSNGLEHGRLRRISVLGVDNPLRKAISDAEEAEIDRRRWLVGLGEPAMLFYTSGTTSRPKGVHLTHESISRVTRAAARRWKMTGRDVMLSPMPSFHTGGVHPMLQTSWVGAKFVPMSYFDEDVAVSLIENEKCTILFPGFPKMASGIYEHERFGDLDVSQVRLIANAAPPEVLMKTDAAFPNGSVITPYGGTEMGAGAAFGDVDESLELRMTSGRPYEGVEVRVVDPQSGRECAKEEKGELQVRTFAMMSGYHNDPERSAEAFTEDGWLKTGDAGYLLGSGHIQYLARLKETMKVGGENIAPLEIESLLLAHEDVLVAQVAGIPDEELGEVPAAWVELEAGSELAEEDLLEYCRERIARFKVPRYMRIVSNWPMSATKVQKNRLVEDLIAELDATGLRPKQSA